MLGNMKNNLNELNTTFSCYIKSNFIINTYIKLLMRWHEKEIVEQTEWATGCNHFVYT